MNKQKNVFISHYNKDDEHIKNLKTLLGGKGYLLKNASIDSTKPNRANNEEYIKRLLRMRIQWAGTFICLIGPKTHTREWVNWEIEQAAKKGKRIVGIYTNGAGESDLPEEFTTHGTALVGWTSERIIGAIEGQINNFENPDCTPRKNVWASTTLNC